MTEAEEAADPGGLLSQFADPNLIGKLAANPKTKQLLDDPSFVAKVRPVFYLVVFSAFHFTFRRAMGLVSFAVPWHWNLFKPSDNV